MAAENAEEPTVLICPGCACLVADMTVHVTACPGSGGKMPEPAYGDVITEWLDTLDPDELEKAAYATAGMDDNPTTALLAEIRRRAAAL